MTFHPFSPRQLEEGGPAGGSGAGARVQSAPESKAVVPASQGSGLGTGHGGTSSGRRRLPPPAFPPGHRRGWVHRPRAAEGGTGEASTTGEIPTHAYLSPDEGPSRRLQAADQQAMSDVEVAEILETLAQEIRDYQGGRFLWKAGVTPLEGAIRGLISGYLRLGRREGERS